MNKKGFLGVFFLVFLLSACASNVEKRYVFSKPLMFTQFDIIIHTSLPKRVVEKEVNKVWEELDYWFVQLSPAGSGVAAMLNKDSFLASEQNPKAYAVISNFIVRAKKVHEVSGGAFDLTVYPLVRLWGFYKQDAENKVPSAEEISNVLPHIGMDKVIISNDGIHLKNGARLDYGAIAKGFAVDIAVAMLSNMQGLNGGIINAGGNLRIFGNKADGSDWVVGIRDPNGQDSKESVPMYNGESIATSGDYEQFFIAPDGTYYHHIFNPKTGRPVSHNLASVSVIVEGSAETADMLATTFLSAGYKNTLHIIDKMGIKNKVSVFFIERDGETLKTYANDNWMKRKAALSIE